MKQLSILLLFLFVTIVINGQDTIVLKDGNVIIAPIIELNDFHVTFMQMSNIDNPTGYYNMQEVKLVKRSKKKFSKYEIIKDVDSIYCHSFSFIRQQNDLFNYIQMLPKSFQRKSLFNYYKKQYYQAVDNKNVNDVIKNGEIYLCLGAEDDYSSIISGVALLHACLHNEYMVNQLIEMFEHFSKENDDIFREEIVSLKEETHKVLYPPKLEDSIIGAWVMTSFYMNEFNPVIIKIDDVKKGDGAQLYQPGISMEIWKKDGKIFDDSRDKKSQGLRFLADQPLLLMEFASSEVTDRRWLSLLATAGNSISYYGSAYALSRIKTPKDPDKKPSEEERRRMTRQEIYVKLAASGIDAASRNITYSTNVSNVYKFSIFPTFDDVLFGQFTHIKGIMDNDERERVFGEGLVKDVSFVRWEESDSVVFVSINGKPITLKPIDEDSPLLNEYYQVKKKHRYGNAKCLIPSLLFMTLGGIIVREGVQMIESGDALPGAGLCIGGLAITMCSIEIPLAIVKKNRKKEFRRMNEESHTKLYEKYIWIEKELYDE